MGTVALIVKLPAQAGKGADLLAELSKVVAATADEPGTLQYILHTDDNNPDTIWVYEVYSDKAALGAHSAGEVFKATFPVLKSMLAGAPEFIGVTPVVGKGF